MDDDYVLDDDYEYVGEEKHEYTAATNISKEENEMKKMVSPQEIKIHRQTQVNQSSTDTCACGFQKQAQEGAFKTTTKGIILTLLIILAVSVSISLAAIVLSILTSYNVQKIKSVFITHEEFNIISQLSTQLDETNNSITSVATTVEKNISSLFIQLDVVYRFALSMQPEACGTGLWYRVAHLDMRDPSQQCPSAWREYNTSQFRACGRPVSSVASHPSQIFHINHQYSKVCGRAIGIQVASPDAFYHGRGLYINESYMDGVSITRGSPRHHIWSYVGSVSEVGNNVCPCTYSNATQPPSFVGSNYYCESGNPNQYWRGQPYPNDKLWDGEQCSHEGTCCTGTNTPPWFSVTLGSPTSDDIEVRIMGSQNTDDEDTPIELLEIYVQ